VEFAAQLGLAFQIRDDMLDVVGDEQVLGKPIGSDREEGKLTFVDLKGLDGCAKLVDECTARAKAALADWEDNQFLFELADRMVGRNN
jgi:geranylgeranyl diphosphate synthase type II